MGVVVEDSLQHLLYVFLSSVSSQGTPRIFNVLVPDTASEKKDMRQSHRKRKVWGGEGGVRMFCVS